MKRYLLLALVSVLAFPCCRHKKEVVQVTTVSVPVNEKLQKSPVVDSVGATRMADSTVKSVNYRFLVSFYSIGSGRDYQAYMKFHEYLGNYQKQKNKTIITEEAPWGREGEVDYCMRLSELTDAEQSDFITGLKTALTDAKWVHYFENMPCRNKHNK